MILAVKKIIGGIFKMNMSKINNFLAQVEKWSEGEKLNFLLKNIELYFKENETSIIFSLVYNRANDDTKNKVTKKIIKLKQKNKIVS